MDEVFAELNVAELKQLAEEINQQFITQDALVRRVASKVYLVKIEDVTMLQMLMLAPRIALELSKCL